MKRGFLYDLFRCISVTICFPVLFCCSNTHTIRLCHFGSHFSSGASGMPGTLHGGPVGSTNLSSSQPAASCSPGLASTIATSPPASRLRSIDDSHVELCPGWKQQTTGHSEGVPQDQSTPGAGGVASPKAFPSAERAPLETAAPFCVSRCSVSTSCVSFATPAKKFMRRSRLLRYWCGEQISH
jgi:hypothetical protein